MIQGTILVIYPTLLGFGYLKNSPSLPSNNQRSRGARFAWVHKNCVKSDYGVLKVNDADRHEPYSLMENIVAYIIAGPAEPKGQPTSFSENLHVFPQNRMKKG